MKIKKYKKFAPSVLIVASFPFIFLEMPLVFAAQAEALEDLSRLKGQVAAFQVQTQGLLSDKAALQAKIDELAKQSNERAQLADEINVLNDQKEKDKKYIEELKRAIKVNQKESEASKQQILDLQAEVKKMESAQAEASQMLEKQSESEKEKATLVAQIKALDAEKKSFLAEKEQLEKQMSTYKIKAEATDLSLKNIRDQDTEKLVASLQTVNNRLETQRKENSTVHYNLATLLMQQARYQDAANEFEQVLTGDVSHGFAHFNLALIYDRYLSKPTEAMEHYASYIRLLPNAVDAKDVEFRIFQLRLNQEKGIGHDLNQDKI